MDGQFVVLEEFEANASVYVAGMTYRRDEIPDETLQEWSDAGKIVFLDEAAPASISGTGEVL